MPSMTFQEEGDYIVCYIDNVEVSRAKKAADGTSTADVINIINDQIKANPTLSGTEPNLTGLQTGDTKYAVPQGSGGSLMSDIVDVNGNHRFVEGAMTFTYDAAYEGKVSGLYAKWSLSGTHLMLVACVENIGDSDLTVSNGELKWTVSGLPSWILNKIYPLSDVTGFIERKGFYSPLRLTSAYYAQLHKLNGNLYIETSGNNNLKIGDVVRYCFDLLIDSE